VRDGRRRYARFCVLVHYRDSAPSFTQRTEASPHPSVRSDGVTAAAIGTIKGSSHRSGHALDHDVPTIMLAGRPVA